MSNDINLDDFAPDYKTINKAFLEKQPKQAVKGVISGAKVVKFKDDAGKEVPTPVILVTSPIGTWDGEMEFSLSAKTNREILKAAYGSASGAWRGKEVGFFIDPTVMYGGKAVGGVRIRCFAPDPFADTPPAPAADASNSVTSDAIPF